MFQNDTYKMRDPSDAAGVYFRRATDGSDGKLIWRATDVLSAVNGNSEQRNLPSPDNPIEILSCGDKTANLFTLSNYTGSTIGGVTVTIDNNKSCITLNGTATSTMVSVLDITTPILDEILNASVLSFSESVSDDSISHRCWVGGVKADGTLMNVLWSDMIVAAHTGGYKVQNQTSFIDTPKYYRPVIGVVSGVTYNNFKIMIQIEEGSTATDYEPYGYKISCAVKGVNLYDVSARTDKMSINEKGVDSSSSISCASDYMAVKANTTYTFSGIIGSGSNDNQIRVHFYDTSKTWVKQIYTGLFSVGTAYSFSVTPTADGYLRISQFMTNTMVQVEEGTTATDYVPYHDPKTWHCYLDEPLRKVGDYADAMTVNRDGTGTLTRNIKELALNTIASSGWTYDSSHTRFRTYLTDMNTLGVRLTPLLSNEFIGVSDGRAIANVPNYGVYSGDLYTKEVCFKTTDVSTVADFVTMVADANIIYPLATSTSESIVWYDEDGNEDIPKLLDGETLDWTTEIQPSAVEVA